MSLKTYISVLLLFLASIFCDAQNNKPHVFIGSASFIGNDLGLSNGIDNISWSIGEVVVFEDDATKGTATTSRFTIAQAMQSYPPFVPVTNCPTITVKGDSVPLCQTSGFTTKLNYISSFPIPVTTTPDVESIQWYFNEKTGNDTIGFSRIAGSTNTTKLDYQPFFPGYYIVCVKYEGINCKSCSEASHVTETSSGNISPPFISSSGSPASQLTASTSGTPVSLQWYVYVEAVAKYLLIAGGANATQNVRYDGDYIVMATYAGGCRLSSFYTVTGRGKSIQRAEDVTYDANTIYIPDETAFSEASLKVYPNPATGQFYVHYQSSTEITTNAELYSNTGIFIKEIAFTEGGTWARAAKVSTDDLSAGVYFLKVNQEAKHLVQKVVIYK